MDLTDRKKQILKVVVEDYIRTAEPVGSKAIAAEMGGSVSSATIRNELSDLVELGYLEQPHTSAGRVPSPKGYRLYVNELMERQRLSLAETEKINQSLQMKMEELDRVISQAGRAVSSFVNYPAYVATAGKGSITASRFDLLPVDEKSCIVVMMMVMMAAAALAVMVVLMLVIVIVVIMVVVVMAAFVAVVIIVVIIMVVVMVATLVAVLIMVMVVVMMLFLILVRMGSIGSLCFAQKLGNQVALTIHNGNDLCTGQFVPIGGHNGGGGVLFLDQGNGCGNLLLVCAAGAAQDDAGCVADLVIIELAKVLHIHFDLVHIGHGHKAVQADRQGLAHTLNSAGHITQFANAGRLDQDAVRMISLHDLFQCLAEVAHQGAADAAGVQLVDLNASLTHKAAVNADLAEFVFDQHDLFTLERFLDELFDQGRFACTQKAGENINFSYLFCHGNIPFYLKVCLCC